MRRERLDALLLERGFADSREQAKRLVLAGRVSVAGTTHPKPGHVFPADVMITVSEGERYVSRGGSKLEAALKEFGISPVGELCADIGASTGGFTDCLLQHGASQVYAVDVGASQLHERLRADPRVVVMDQCNARDLSSERFPALPRLAVVDVSFISVMKILPGLAEAMSSDGICICLIKPQFEAGRSDVSRGKGVIRDKEVHRRVLADILAALPEMGWIPCRLMPSPILGGSGNREFLALLRKLVPNADFGPAIDIDAVTESSS